MAGIAALFTQTASVETLTGQGAYGPVYASPVDVSCFIDDMRKLVRDSKGNEVVSSTTVYAPIGDVDMFTVGSRVTVNGRAAIVLGAYRRDSAGPASAFHTQVELT